MPGGLLNLVAYGNQNLILTGNPSKTFFKCAYAKYTNFGLQRFRLDFTGQRSLRQAQPSVLRFKIPRYGDLLMDTYLVLTMPTIWSTILPPQQAPNDLQGNNNTAEPIVQDNTNVWSPYEFKWIKNLGTQMIKEVKFLVGAQVIQKFTGDYLHSLVERDFDEAKKDLYYKMTGNVAELNDPANAFNRNNFYPSAWPTNSPNYKSVGPEPSIRSRKLYVPLNIWFTMASKMAFPLVSLQYNEMHIEITLRPVNELYVIRDVESVGDDIRPNRGVPVGNYIQPNVNNQLHQMYRFLQPPPDPIATPNATTYKSLKDMVKSDYYIDQRINWAADIHLISTYAFLSDDEVKVFALQPQNYLIKEVYQTEYKNVVGTQKVTLETSGLVSNWMWFFQRTDAFMRNEWSNYTNWPYSVLPNNLVDPLDYNDVPYSIASASEEGIFDNINIAFAAPLPPALTDLGVMEGDYKNTRALTSSATNLFKHADPVNNGILQLHHTGGGLQDLIYTTASGGTSFTMFLDSTTNHHTFEVEEPVGVINTLQVRSTFGSVYVPPLPIGQTIDYEDICDTALTNEDGIVIPDTNPTAQRPPCCDNWWNIPDTMQSCKLNPSYNPFYVKPAVAGAAARIYPELPYYKTDFKITGNFDSSNHKDIMITWALIMDGKYRETELDAGVLNYVEKYVRTSGNAPDGLYCYNFGLHSSPFDFQPSGAMNLSKFRTIEFEVSTFAPPSDPNAETLTICDSDGNIVGVNKPVWRVYEYTYNLVVMEERYNILKFVSGNAALAYAR